jgi:hypothetical protein
MMSAGDSLALAVLAGALAWLIVQQEKEILDLREDIDLLARGDTSLLAAKRKLGRLRSETERL